MGVSVGIESGRYAAPLLLISIQKRVSWEEDRTYYITRMLFEYSMPVMIVFHFYFLVIAKVIFSRPKHS